MTADVPAPPAPREEGGLPDEVREQALASVRQKIDGGFVRMDDGVRAAAEVAYSAGLAAGEAPDEAPTIDSKRPFGNSDITRDIAEAIWPTTAAANLAEFGDIGNSLRDQANALYAELGTALEVVLRTGSFAPGLYRRSKAWTSDWTPATPAPATPGGRS